MFDYGVVAQEIQDFRNRGFEVGVIGKTVLRQPIPYIKIGNGGARIIITGGIHAREYITTLLVLKLASIAEKQYPKGTIYFIPAVNPDGIRLCTEGLSFFKALLTNPSQSSLSSAELVKIAENLISYNRNDDFRLWKANANGVDLNVNFDAEWGKGKSNVFYPRASDYVGKAPFSEPESRALALFTLKVRPTVTLSYHSKGEVIYWYFNQREKRLWRDYTMAKNIARSTGYTLLGREGSVGGYKDWCVSVLKIPSFTLEVAPDSASHPVNCSYLDSILYQNNSILDTLLAIATSRRIL